MANLVSPGVSVSVTDESFYIGAGGGTVPLIMIATQTNKPVSAGTEVINPDVAAGTLASNAGKLWLISSQRELLQSFGTPIFYNEGGAQLHGSPINEYGLLAAYSYLGISNRAYVVRADIDTYELQPSDSPLSINPSLYTSAPGDPIADSYWHDSSADKIDLLVNGAGGIWEEFEYNIWAYNVDPTTDPQADDVLEGDIWLDISDVVNYPALREYDVNGQWHLIDNSDSNKIIFADARPMPLDENDEPVALDSDAPSTGGRAAGVLLFNTRHSGLNVKQYKVGHESGENGDRWVSVSGLAEDGSFLAGDAATKKMVVNAMREAMIASSDIRSESVFYNLIASPGYPEMISTMQSLNIDRNEEAFVIGDSPFTLQANGTAIQNWANNADGALEDGDVGLVSSSPFTGVWYPGGAYTSNLDGNLVVQPSSHVALYTIAYSDQVAYQWFAPAGLQRGAVTNASSVGYVDDEGEYVSVSLNPGLRDVIYVNKLNPIAVIPNRGLYVWGQKTLSPSASALDRVNVARLINYIRYQVAQGVYPYLFEPNDELTRKNAKGTIDGMLSELITLRGLYDYAVVCDKSNNTPARIDRNEMWVDIAIQPTKAVEFIYVPIRILNTGADF